MPLIDFDFVGNVCGAEVTNAYDPEQDKTVDVRNMSSAELAEKLNAGKLYLELGRYLYMNRKDSEVELSNFRAT